METEREVRRTRQRSRKTIHATKKNRLRREATEIQQQQQQLDTNGNAKNNLDEMGSDKQRNSQT